MPIGAITMILTNVGLQIYNNWCSSRQNARLQQKREEFERAARERNTQRMWQIMREGQELTKALEEERHRQRIDELKNDIGSLLQKLAYTATINNWPLNVLPIVMKNQALGNILANQEESIALHCIFTPSNSNDFNKFVFPRIEEALESYCNQYWSVMSKHPILFYSGAWKSAQSPTGIQIDSMRTALSNLPVLVITPFFRPNDGKLVFQIRLWGVGASSTDEFSIPETVPTEFQRDYNIDDDYVNELEIIDELIEDTVPYLQCVIGYMADTYFWSSAGMVPHLPLLITNGTINTNGLKYLVDDSREYYNQLLHTSEENAKDNPFMQENVLNLFKGSSVLWNEKIKYEKLEEIFVNYCNRKYNETFSTMDDALNFYPFNKEDFHFIDSYLKFCKDDLYKDALMKIRDKLDNKAETIAGNLISTLSECDISKLKSQAECGDAAAYYRLGELYEYSIGVDYNPDEYKRYYSLSCDCGFMLAEIRHKIFALNGQGITSTDFAYLRNNETAQFIIFRAICLYKGYGTDLSVEEAMEDLEKLSNSTHPYAYYISAQIVKEQYGEEQGELIVDLLLKSANLGYVEAQVDLMNVYYEGRYVQENPQLSVEYAQKAALQAHPEALFTLAIYLLRGYGTKCNKAKAKDFLYLAAERGNNDAIEILKSMSK